MRKHKKNACLLQLFCNIVTSNGQKNEKKWRLSVVNRKELASKG